MNCKLNFFQVDHAWQQHCIDQNIKDPWVLMNQCENKVNKHWKEIDDKGNEVWCIDFHLKEEWPPELLEEYNQLKLYRDQYLCDREIWEGEYILENFGYDALIEFAQMHRLSETAPAYNRAFHEWYHNVRPCEGKEGQCNLLCLMFGNNCPYQESSI